MINSVSRALSILECFSREQQEIGVSEIARLLDLNKSTVFGLISTLEQRRYLEKNKDTGRYRLGIRLLDLAALRLAGFEFAAAAHPILRQLMSELGETVHLAVYDRGEVIYIDKLEATNTIQISSFIGNRNPAYCTGVGKCLLAFQPEEEIERVIHQGLIPRTNRTITNPAELRTALQRVRSENVSYDDEEFETGLVCVAAPVHDRFGDVCAAISISSPTIRTDRKRSEEFSFALRRAAADISRAIGYTG